MTAVNLTPDFSPRTSVRTHRCWIESFVDLVHGKQGYTERFARAVALSLIAAAVGRKGYVDLNGQALFLNMYLGLIAKPGSGKSRVMAYGQAVVLIANSFSDGTFIQMGNDSETKASLIKTMQDKFQEVTDIAGQKLVRMHQMTCWHDELLTFMPTYDPHMIGALLKLWDCPEHYKETRITAGERELHNVFFNWLFGTQPDNWAQLFANMPEVGIKSRMILCSEDFDIFQRDVINMENHTEPSAEDQTLTIETVVDPAVRELLTSLARDLAIMANQTKGRIGITREAAEAINAWWKTGGNPIPHHLSSGDYPVRRPLQCLKIAGTVAVSRGKKSIDLEAFREAQRLLFDFEESTKHITANLRQSDHGKIMDDVYSFFYSKTVADGKIKQFSGQDLRKFISMRVKIYEVDAMVKQLVQTGRLLLAYSAEKTEEKDKLQIQLFTINPRYEQKNKS